MVRNLAGTLLDGGALGIVQFVAQAIPATAVAPLLLFVGVEIVSSEAILGSGHTTAISWIFSIVSLVTRDFAPVDARLAAATARLRAIPAFLADARRTLSEAPEAWRLKALRECEGAAILFGLSLPAWIPVSGAGPAVAGAATTRSTVPTTTTSGATSGTASSA